MFEEISLYSAAQVVGFWKFGIGWDWSEFHALSRRDHSVITEIAGQTINLRGKILQSAGMPEESILRRSTQISAARRARRSAVEAELIRLIRTGRITPILTDENMRSHRIGHNISMDVAMRIDVLKNSIGLEPMATGQTWDFGIPGDELISALQKSPAIDKKRSRNDWLLVEVLARHFYERSPDLLPVARCAEMVMQLYSDAQKDPVAPARSEVNKYIALIGSEYASTE